MFSSSQKFARLITSGRLGVMIITLVIAGASLLLAGCGGVAAATYVIAGPTKTVVVPAQYTGLEGRTIAVMIAGDEYMLYRFPDAQNRLAANISARIAENVDGARVVNPATVTKFQKDNPEWMTLPYGELIRKINVERLVIVDLSDYRLHDPGNSSLWRAVISGNVGVIEAEDNDPDNYAFYTNVKAHFPEDGGIGVLNSDAETVELAVSTMFSKDVAQLFYQHEKEVDR